MITKIFNLRKASKESSNFYIVQALEEYKKGISEISLSIRTKKEIIKHLLKDPSQTIFNINLIFDKINNEIEDYQYIIEELF